MSSTSDFSNNDRQTAQLYGTGGLGIPAGTNAQRPADPTPGMLRWNTTSKRIEFRGPTAWTSMLGTPELDAGYVSRSAPKIDADMDAQSHKITNLATPTANGDAINLAYLNQRLSGSGLNADTLDGHDSSYFATQDDLQSIVGDVGGNLGQHLADFNNPHHVTKAQVGLGSYPNDPMNLPVSVATLAALTALGSNTGTGFLSKSGGTMTGNIDMGGNNIVGIMNFVGMVQYFALANAPAGFLVCNGQAVSRTTYARLFAKIGTTFGNGDGSTTFNLPDLRGYFIRGLALGGANGAPASVLGGVQADMFKEHAHPGSAVTQSGSAHQHTGRTDQDDALSRHRHKATGSTYSNPGNGYAGEIGNVSEGNWMMTDNNDANSEHRHNFTTNNGGQHDHGLNIVAQGGTETRPMNVSLLPCIMY